jgi:hypothetical protein
MADIGNGLDGADLVQAVGIPGFFAAEFPVIFPKSMAQFTLR